MTAEPGGEAAAAFLRGEGFSGPYACAIVTGTGLGAVAERLQDRVSLPCARIPGFPALGVSGHAGTLHRGFIEGRAVLLFEGRAHAYESGDAAAMRVPIATAAMLGIDRLLLTCSCGSLDPQIGPGHLVALSDHINLSGRNPLVGEPSDARFVPMVDAYDPELRQRLLEAAQDSGIVLSEGVYAWFLGPSFETPAEIRMARVLGADLVGMSTAPEAILGRFFGMRVAAIGLVTNLAAGLQGGDPDHAQTREVAGRAAGSLATLVERFVAALPSTGNGGANAR